jgi:hypothetical protein
VKDDMTLSGSDAQEMTTPIMYPKDENYIGIKEVIGRDLKSMGLNLTNVSTLCMFMSIFRAKILRN